MSTNEKDLRKDLKQKERLDTRNDVIPSAPPQLPPRLTGLTEPIAHRPSVVTSSYPTELLPTEYSQNLPLYKDAPVEKQIRGEEFSQISLKNDERQKLQLAPGIELKLKNYIPPGYQLSCTANNEDNWWDSVARSLNYLVGNDKTFSVESLRLLMSEIVKNDNNRPSWFTTELLNEYGYEDEKFYLARISETVSQMREHNTKLTLTGDAIPGSDVEARLLCTKFPVAIHWIEISDDGEIYERLTNSEGTADIEPLDKQDYANEHNLIHLVVYKNHVTPLINFNNKPVLDANLLSSIQDVARTSKIPLDRTRRLSNHSSKSNVVRAVEELFNSEKIYHERIRQFALAKVPGKEAKPKKSNLQKLLLMLGIETHQENNEDKQVLEKTWPEIRKIAIENRLDKLVDQLDNFVSNYTNPENDEKEIIYSTDTVNQVNRSWQKIKINLLEQYLLTHSCEFEQLINVSFIDKFPPGLEKLNKFLRENIYNISAINRIDIDEIIKTCLARSLPRDWTELKKFLKENNIYNNFMLQNFDSFISKMQNFDNFIMAATQNKLPGGWERLKKLLNDNKLYTSEVITQFVPFISKYTGLAQSPHAFSKIDALEDDKDYQHLVEQGMTDENITDWIDIIYDAVIGKSKEITIKDPKTEEIRKVIQPPTSSFERIYKQMAALSAYYEHVARLRDIIAKNLNENKHKMSETDLAYIKEAFGSGVEGYLQKSLILVVQRIALYVLLVKEIQEKLKLASDHPAQKQLTEIRERLNQLGRMANEVPKQFSKIEDKINPENYRLDRPYSGYGLGNNYYAISYMAKLGRLINCWQNNELGREVLLPRGEKLDEEFKKAEIELNAARIEYDRVKRAKTDEGIAKENFDRASANFDKARANSFIFKTLRARIWERKYSEDQYVKEFQNFLQQLFIDSKQYFSDPITSKIDSKIEEIVSKINDSRSIFANTLINLRRQFRNEVQSKGLVAPHFSFPLDIFDDCFISNIQSPAKVLNDEARNQSRGSLQKQISITDERPIASSSKLNAEDEKNAKQAQHYMRLTIINRVKEIFQKFDQQSQQALLIKTASDSIQKTSYRIQQDLDELSKYSLEEYEGLFNIRSDKEIIGEVIIKRIRPYLDNAGILKESFLTGNFGTMLHEATDYINHISQTYKSPLEMFIHNFLPVRDANQTTAFFHDQRKPQVKLSALIWNLLAITDFYRRTGLGLLIAERAGVKPNNKFRHIAEIRKLAELTEKYALNANIGEEMDDDRAKYLLKDLLKTIKKEIIDPFPDHNSRSVNELIHLFNHFSKDFSEDNELKEIEQRDIRRFENYKLIVNYQASKEDAELYLNKHIAQKYASTVLEYSLKIDGRVFIETAVSKEETLNEMLKIINEIYEMPVAICKIRMSEELPEDRRNISCLIQHRVNEYVKKALSNKSVYQQGHFGKMLQRINDIHREFNPGVANSNNSSLRSLLNISEEQQPLISSSLPLTGKSARRSLTSSFSDDSSVVPRTPLKTPVKPKVHIKTPTTGKAPRRMIASMYSAPISNQENESVAKKSLILLIAQLQALSHYYCNTEIGKEICNKLQISSNADQQGQKKIAEQLANFALEIFFEDEADVDVSLRKNVEQNMKSRNQRANARLERLQERMKNDIKKIRGEDGLFDSIIFSPDSRFAKAVEELLPGSKARSNNGNVLQFTKAINDTLYNDTNTAKHFIHRVVIEQSYKQFEDLETSLMGSFKKKAGNPQQIATHKIHLALRDLSAKPLNTCEAEISKLSIDKNIRGLISDKVSASIVSCGVIANSIFDGLLGDKLLNVANFLFNKKHTKTNGNFLTKIFTPNQVRRYPNPTHAARAVENTKLAFCGRLLMLSDYYLDKPLGRQVADKAANITGNVAIYNDNNKGWAEHAEKIKTIATGIYFGKFKKDNEVIAAIQDALNHLNIIIKDIRRPNLFEQIFLDGSSGKHSRFVNELIRIVTDFGKEQGLNISPAKQINERHQFNNAKEIFNNKIGSDNFEDYIHMHVIQNSASKLVQLKNEINGHRWTSFSEKETLRIAEENLDKLFKAGIKERRELIAALPKGQQDLCHLIRDKIKDKIPYSFWSANIQRGRLQQPTQRIDEYLKVITQLQSSPIISMSQEVKIK